MITNRNTTDLPIGSLLQIKEEQGIRFYRDCIHRTNQFSTKFILQKFLRDYQDQVEKLKAEFQVVAEKSLAERFLDKIEKSDKPQDLCKEFDLSTLTFIEATKLAIRLAENDIGFYGHFLDHKLNKSSRQALERIISNKSDYIRQLKSEYKKIFHSNKM